MIIRNYETKFEALNSAFSSALKTDDNLSMHLYANVEIGHTQPTKICSLEPSMT